MTRVIRCAIYTRKSTEEGLDQAFNSLDAQREACVSYIKSQAGEGWRVIDRSYDDGGYSGGSMERPALQKLLADIDQSLIDVVVVYKIDRLTRSLADFAKIVERLEKRNASFVSVTQAFNTTTSMGRLTLNVLLSFAQFEREVTAERIRDKIAASRAKGIFMGGCPPLGYDAHERKLVINESEAKTVRHIFERYLALRSIGKLAEELNADGITTKSFVSTRGRSIGGGQWYVGPLRHILRNPVYIGVAVHKGKSYAGEHRPLVSSDLFEEVQSLLTGSAKGWQRKRTVESSALLTGLLHDDKSNRMSPQWSIGNGGRKYCYYVSQALLQRRRGQEGSLPRVRASLVDDLVSACADAFAGARSCERQPDIRQRVNDLVTHVIVSEDEVRIHVRHGLPEDKRHSFEKLLTRALACLPPGSAATTGDEGCQISIPVKLRTGTAMAIGGVTASIATPRRINKPLLAALARAHVWRRLIETGQVQSVEQIATRDEIDRKDVRRILRLAFLAPDLQQAIVEGRQPTRLSIRALAGTDLPCEWSLQREDLSSAQAFVIGGSSCESGLRSVG